MAMPRSAYLRRLQSWSAPRPSRRLFLAGTAASLWAAPPATPSVDVAIVGAGLAGLTCADQLQAKGLTPTVYEAASRPGGRCWSLSGFFPSQVAERGGEFIDTGHKTMIAYARRFGLPLEDVNKEPGDIRYYFRGQVYPETQVVAEYRAFVDAMRDDLRQLSGEVTALSKTPADEAFDRISLAQYLDSRDAGPLIKAVIREAYLAEYGLEAEDQSCLNFLFFIHADRRSKFTPFGVFSDERYHVVNGNEGIVAGLAAGLQSPIQLDCRLLAASRTAAGRIALTFRQGSRTVTYHHDAAVLTLPFTVLRTVHLDASLALPTAKRAAIEQLGYGNNAKMMLGFNSRPWATVHQSNGASYSDLTNHQASWETNPVNASVSRGVITDYSGGDRGAGLRPSQVQAEAQSFLTDFDRVYPGAMGAASRNQRGELLVHLEHWPSNPLSRGSYTCYRPGQFTTIAGYEATPVNNLFFAGEHTDSFYSWQGFMEGACLSGIAAASAILRK